MSVRLEAIAQCDAEVEVLYFGQACVYAHGFFIEIVEVVAETVAVHVGQAPVAADDEVAPTRKPRPASQRWKDSWGKP